MKYTIALIGCGRISFKHVEGFTDNIEKLTFVAACDPVEEKASAKVAEYLSQLNENGVNTDQLAIKVYSDYRKMLQECQPDIVTLATESGKHKAIAMDCLHAGAHVICEKPMALSTDDAQAMIDCAEKNNKKLAVCFQNRFNAPIQQLREAVQKGRFGRILHGMIQIRWNRNEDYYAAASWRGTWAPYRSRRFWLCHY